MNAATSIAAPVSQSWERKLFGSLLGKLRGGQLTVWENGRASEHGEPAADGLAAVLHVHEEAFYRRAVLGGEIGMGESYMEGDWSSPDLVSLIRLAVRNLEQLDAANSWLNGMAKWVNRLRHTRRDNTIDGSRENIHQHYDLSNDFFRLWLDETMSYSAGMWLAGDESLEQAQRNKIDRACRQLRLGPEDHLLEIGTGWGGLAMHAAARYGCRVTTTTISREQFELAQERIAAAGLAGRITVLLEDYRNLRGNYSKAVSVEMFEAVGLRHYDEYFRAVGRMLAPGGSFLLQTITMNERSFEKYQQSTDWIQKYIFPGGELSSTVAILQSVARTGRMQLGDLQEFGDGYARTLRQWRENFHAKADAVRSLGFDGRFCRMWDYYLSYCEGSFRERYIGVVQMRFDNPV
jgi:cyclopropane-fatty-acyl-phospholipid synthase